MKAWLKLGELGPLKPMDKKYDDKRMLLVVMDYNDIAFYKLYDKNEMINAKYYKSTLKEEIPKWLKNKSFKKPILLHDNAKPHKAKLV